MSIPQVKRALPAMVLCAATAEAPTAHAAPTQWRATDLGSPGGGHALVEGLNAAGQACAGGVTLFFYGNGEMVDLGGLPDGFGDFALHADAYLNDTGRIGGSGFDCARQARSAAATPRNPCRLPF